MSKKIPRLDKHIKKKDAHWFNDDVKAHTGLPPQVDGQIRCFCKLSVSQIVWTIPKPPDLALVRVKWWGEESAGILFRPLDVKNKNKAKCHTTSRYPVRSGPSQFATYLNDMGSLTMDLLTAPDSDVIGQASISQIGLLSNTRPINGFFPVISATGQKLANLQVSIVLEPLMASYDSKGAIPTTDSGFENTRSNDAMVVPEAHHPLPYSELPTRPDSTVFITPPAMNDNFHGESKSSKRYFADDLRQQLNYGLPGGVGDVDLQQQLHSGTVAITTSGDVVSLPDSRALTSNSGFNYSSINNSSTSGGKGSESSRKPTVSAGKDLLSVLVEKGTKLREAMIVSSMHSGGEDVALRKKSDLSKSPVAGLVLSNGASESALDHLLASPFKNQDFQLYNLMNNLSPGTSMSSDLGQDHIMSEPEDPLHDNSILQDLFYYHSDNGDINGYDHQHQQYIFSNVADEVEERKEAGYPLDRPGNQRQPSRAFSLPSLSSFDENGTSKEKSRKTKQRVCSRSRSRSTSQSRSTSRSRSRSNSQTRSRSESPRKLAKTLKPNEKENSSEFDKNIKTLKPKKKIRSRSNSRSRSRSRSRKRKPSVGSDSDQMSTARSETSKVSFDLVATDMNKPKQEGLSVERLTLLGRVHVARVNVDYLKLIKPDDMSYAKFLANKIKSKKPPRPQKSKKLSTYFVEYQFPVVAASRDKYTPNAIVTEVTRVASKNIKDGAVIFNHRSVFPIMFDGAAVEQWWKSALVFRLYCKEAGQHTPILVGSGGISLKSILCSENLFVEREIEIPDTSKYGLLNHSLSSSLNSSVNERASPNLLGNLKISVELASDQKEFATVMARTKLAEMSGNVKIVPIGGANLEQARLVEQLNRNKDQPVIKSPTKKIDLPVTTSQSLTNHALKGLPPQSPRKKAADSPSREAEVEDEISRLKQQLKATVALLNNSGPQNHGATSHLDFGAQVFGGQHGAEAHTLHTLLLIQEGRNISVHGVPPFHMVNKNPALLQLQSAGVCQDSMIRNTYLICRMFWCSDAVHSNVCWGTLNPEYNFLQVAPVLMTAPLLERMKDNYMIIEVWDKKVSSDNDKLIGMVKLSLHQFYLSFRERKIANALLKSQYPVMAIDNYMPIIDPFSGLHFGQLKVILAMGSEQQTATLQRLAFDKTGTEPVPQKPVSYWERQDLFQEGAAVNSSSGAVEHQFEITVEGIRGLKLFESMIWGEADCFIQFFFPSEEEAKDNTVISIQSIPTMKCFRTATTLCIPDPTFHDTCRHKLTLPLGVPVQRELLTACSNSGGGASGLPFEVWCRYYYPNVRDQLIAKSTLPLAKLCAMITMHKRGESCVQSFSLRLSQVGVEGQQNQAEFSAKARDAGFLDVIINYKAQKIQSASTVAANRNHDGSQVCLSVGIIRASGLKAAAEYVAQLDSSMAYPADVGVNAYVRVNISFLGKMTERVTKTVARSFAPEFAHYMDFPCPLLMPGTMSSDATSLAELLESAEVTFEVWHQIPADLHKDFNIEKGTGGLQTRKLAHQTGDILLGTVIVPLMALLSRRTGLNGWFAINLPSLGWAKPIDDHDLQHCTALDQVVAGLEISLRFASQDDRDRVISVARSVGWSPLDLEIEQSVWQDEDSHHNVHNIVISIEQVSFPLASSLLTGQSELDPSARCYVRYKLYDKGAVMSKSQKLHASDTGSLLCMLSHKHSFIFSHTPSLQWYLREERLEIQAWVTYGKGTEGERKPRQRDKLIGSCYIDLESLTDMRRRQQRVSGLFPLFKPGASNLKAAFIRSHITSRVSSGVREQTSESDIVVNGSNVSMVASETDQSSDSMQQDNDGDFIIDKSPRKKKKEDRSISLQESFGVFLVLERAMHLPRVTERNRSGEIFPSTYVSYQSAERAKPTCSTIFPNSVNPVWDFSVETRLNKEYLYKENKNLVLKVWHKPSNAPKSPDKSSDKVLGFVSVDLSPLAKGLQQICGWYNILDLNSQCQGQMKVSITPQDLHGRALSGSLPSASFMVPHFGLPSFSLSASAQPSTIAQQLMSLQQQVKQRMKSLAEASAATILPSQNVILAENSANKDHEISIAVTTSTSNRQPESSTEIRVDDPSKSYLFASLKRQLQDLDTITNRLKARLSASMEAGDSSHQLFSARSGETLSGTQSGLSTIHTSSSLMNTRDTNFLPSQYNASSLEVAMSQESARSHIISNSSSHFENVRNSGDNFGIITDNHARRLLDSGIFSAKNFSEKSGDDVLDSQWSDKNAIALTSSDISTTLPSTETQIPQISFAVSTLETRFLASAADKTQTLLPMVDSSESSGNSHGFIPATHQSTVTESFSVKGLDKGKSGSKGEVSGSSGASQSGSRHSQSHSRSESARSEKSAVEDKKTGHYESDTEEEDAEGQASGRYGSYHRYRELLDAEEDEREDEEVAKGGEGEHDIVEVIPRSLNNMSTVLALSATGGVNSESVNRMYKPTSSKDGDLADTASKLDKLALSSASLNANAHEGTSIWCSDDNDSFFHHVFEKNRGFMIETGDSVEDIKVDSWLQEQHERVSKDRLETWLDAHACGESRRQSRDDITNDGDDEIDRTDTRIISAYEEEDEQEDTPKPGVDNKMYDFHNHILEDGDSGEEVTPRSTEIEIVNEEDMRLELGYDSEEDSVDEDTVRGLAANDEWNKSMGNCNDKETSRDMWTKQRVSNGAFEEQKKQNSTRLKELHLCDDDDGDEVEKECNKVTEEFEDKVSALPNSIMSSSHNIQSSTSAQNGKTLHSAFRKFSSLNGQKLQSTLNEVSILPPNQITVADEHPLTLELADSCSQYMGEGARPKVQHLLSNVDLESCSSSQRPNTGSSDGSRISDKSHQSKISQVSRASKNGSLKSFSGSSKDSKKSERYTVSGKFERNNNSARSSQHTQQQSIYKDNSLWHDEELSNQSLPINGSKLPVNGSKINVNNNSQSYNEVNTSRQGYNDRDSTLDFAFVEGDNNDVPATELNSVVIMNGHSALAKGQLPEHSGLKQQKKWTVGSDCNLPNFFMPEEDMQASIRALQMATTAAAKINEDDLRSQNKTKTVSELVMKMATVKPKPAHISVKNKQPPSEEEAKRIAKIFSSKLS